MAKPLRIGVNALFLLPGGVGGTEVYLRNLLAAIAMQNRGHQFVIFRNNETGDDITPTAPGFRSVATGINATSRPRRILYEQSGLIREALSAGIDLMFNPGFTSPQRLPRPNVTIIHDLQHHRHPEFFKWSDLQAWRLLVWASARHSSQILTVSDASREDIHAVYGVPLSRIHTAEPGVEPAFFSLSRTEEESLILCVSTLHPHKNIERLVDAFAAFLPNHPGYKLVLAGMRGFHGEHVERRIAQHRLGQSVRLTGWIPRSEIMSLYRRARFAIFPSTFEGFGMPVPEAMAAGVPLITSDIRPMTDIAGDTALLFPAADTAALTAAMERFANSPEDRADYARRARQRARAYTWDRAATITLAALEAAV